MTNILAIDTTTQACSVALHCRSKTLAKYKLASREHTRLLLPMIDEVLSEADIVLSQVDAIAFTSGPGSFTGIRIGFGVVQGLAFGADIPVLPVSSLETLAYTAIRTLPLSSIPIKLHQELSVAELKSDRDIDSSSEAMPRTATHITIIPMLDARMDEIYWAHFQLSLGQEGPKKLIRISKDNLSSAENITLDTDQSTELVVVGDGWNHRERMILRPAVTDTTMLPDAQDILTIAIPQIKAGKTIAIEQASPMYLRDTISWKKRTKLRK